MSTAQPREPSVKEGRSTRIDPIETLAQADLLLMLAQLLSPPWRRASSIRETASLDDAQVSELLRMAGVADRPGLAQTMRRTLATMRTTDEEDWRDEYTGLFEGGIPCPINEAAYIRRDKGTLLADVAGFHQAFGFALADDAAEKPDHLVCELQFVAMLLVMLARARQEKQSECVEVTAAALDGFARDHLGEWLPIFCERLAEKTCLPAMQNLADALHRAWQAIVIQRELPQPEEPEAESGLKDDENGTPYECGMAEHESVGAANVNLTVNGIIIPR